MGAGLTVAALPTALVLSSLNIGPASQVCGEPGTQLLFATGGDGAIVQIDVSGVNPVETTIVAAGVIDALLANPLIGISTPAVLSGICVIDATRLAVIEGTSNTILEIDRLVPDTVSLMAGFPSETPGSADAPRALARFAFSEPSSLIASGDDALLVVDGGNHTVRRVDLGADGAVTTLSGLGTPFFNDGDIAAAAFDTPSGIALACSGEILVVEAGTAGNGGHRLRRVSVGSQSFFGLLGSVETLAGDGQELTVGGSLASLAGPTGLLSTSDGQVYWMDGSSGFLRSYSFATGDTDCPGFVDCATATAGAAPFLGPAASLALDDVAGVLYVLDPSATTLYSL